MDISNDNCQPDKSTREILEELELLKSQWQSVNSRLDRLQTQLLDEGRAVATEQRLSARQLLIRKYRKFVYIGGAMILTIPFVFSRMLPDLGVAQKNSILVILLFEVYFLLASSFDFWLMYRWKEIDMAQWPVCRVRRDAQFLRKRHHQFMMILIVLAIITVGYFVYNLVADPAIILGVVTGGIFGAILGIRDYRKMMKAYKDVMQSQT